MPLTDEDRSWIAALMGSVRTGLTERIDSLRTEMIERIDSLRTDMLERIEKTETTLLTEFHKWASPVELRQRSHAAAMRAFDAELEAVSDRVTKVERRNPPAA